MSQADLTSANASNDRPSGDVAPARRRQWLRFLVWAVGIVVIGGMLGSVMLPSLCRSRETANRVKCSSNLRQIGQAIFLYAGSHGGQFPSSLAVLLANEDLVPEVMICPSSNDEKAAAKDTAGIVAELTAAEMNEPGHSHCMSYVFVGQGLTSKTATENSIVAYEPLENHDNDGVNVLFGDGHAEFFMNKSWIKIAADAGIKITPPPGR